MWKSPIPHAVTAKQWQKINRDLSEDAGQSDCESPSPLLFLISSVSIVSVRRTSHQQLNRSQSIPTSNAFFHGEGFRVNSSWAHLSPVVNFVEIRVLQACTCSQRFDLAQVRPFSFPSLCTPHCGCPCALCGPHHRLTRSRRGSRFACMRVS